MSFNVGASAFTPNLRHNFECTVCMSVKLTRSVRVFFESVSLPTSYRDAEPSTVESNWCMLNAALFSNTNAESH